MILTITPNAHIERTFVVENLSLGADLNAQQEVVMPAGTGVSVSLVLKELRGQTLTSGLISGFNGDYFLDLLDHLGVHNQFVRCSGETATAFHLVEFDRRRETSTLSKTLFGLPDHADKLSSILESHAADISSVVLGGNLPSGIPMSTFGRLIEKARSKEVFTVLQAFGRGLEQGVKAKPNLLRITYPDLAKLDSAFTPEIESIPALLPKLKKHLGDWASDAIMVLLSSHLALAVTKEGNYQALAEEVPFVNRTGVEEAFTAGVLLAYLQNGTWRKALPLGMAAASAAILQVGKAVCRYKDVEAILPTIEIKEYQ